MQVPGPRWPATKIATPKGVGSASWRLTWIPAIGGCRVVSRQRGACLDRVESNVDVSQSGKDTSREGRRKRGRLARRWTCLYRAPVTHLCLLARRRWRHGWTSATYGHTTHTDKDAMTASVQALPSQLQSTSIDPCRLACCLSDAPSLALTHCKSAETPKSEFICRGRRSITADPTPEARSFVSTSAKLASIFRFESTGQGSCLDAGMKLDD